MMSEKKVCDTDDNRRESMKSVGNRRNRGQRAQKNIPKTKIACFRLRLHVLRFVDLLYGWVAAYFSGWGAA